MRTTWFTQQKHQGLYQNKVTCNLAAIPRPGPSADNCKMVYSMALRRGVYALFSKTITVLGFVGILKIPVLYVWPVFLQIIGWQISYIGKPFIGSETILTCSSELFEERKRFLVFFSFLCCCFCCYICRLRCCMFLSMWYFAPFILFTYNKCPQLQNFYFLIWFYISPNKRLRKSFRFG